MLQFCLRRSGRCGRSIHFCCRRCTTANRFGTRRRTERVGGFHQSCGKGRGKRRQPIGCSTSLPLCTQAVLAVGFLRRRAAATAARRRSGRRRSPRGRGDVHETNAASCDAYATLADRRQCVGRRFRGSKGPERGKPDGSSPGFHGPFQEAAGIITFEDFTGDSDLITHWTTAPFSTFGSIRPRRPGFEGGRPERRWVRASDSPAGGGSVGPREKPS